MKRFLAVVALLALCLPAMAYADAEVKDAALGDKAVSLKPEIKKSYLTFTSDDGKFQYKLVSRPYVSDNKDVVIALGLNLLRQTPEAESATSDQDKVRFDARPEARILNYKYQKTAKIANVDYWDVYGLEFAGKYKKFSWQSEYMKTSVEVSDGTVGPEFDGWYANVSYFITDDQRLYNLDDGEFGCFVFTGR